MSILSALVDRFDRTVAAGDAPAPGYVPTPLHFVLVLRPDGSVAAVEDERVKSGKVLRPKTINAPAAPKRTVNVASRDFLDKTSYVLGRGKGNTVAHHAAFKERHETLLSGVNDAGCAALLAFLRFWSPDRYDALPNAAEMIDCNVAFRLYGDSVYVHDRPAAHALLAAAGGDAGSPGICLVAGATVPIARLHPSIKGVRGAQSSGASLVSFNSPAYRSYGLDKGDNAPVSAASAYAYGVALNALLASSGTSAKGRPIWRNRVTIGEATTVFWAERGDAEDMIRAAIDGDDEDLAADAPVDEATETDALRSVLHALQDGVPLQDAAPDLDPETRVYVLGLKPSAARLSVSYWRDGTLADFAEVLQQHWADLRIDPAPRKQPPVWRLVAETARDGKSDEVQPGLAADVMRSILFDTPYPPALLAQTVRRIDAERDVNPVRAAIIKACLSRLNDRKERIPVSLDLSAADPAYRMGCLFAVLERLQRAALGKVGASIRDRYMSKAATTPAGVMPVLLDGASAHNKVIRSRPGGGGLAEWFETRISDTLAGIDHMPTILPPLQRGRFYLGYYQQRAALSRQTPKEIETVEAIADAETSTGK